MVVGSERETFLLAAGVEEVRSAGCVVVALGGETVALFADGEQIYAVDNRCPHMGFPLHRGTLKDGILTCHWHHARFELASGGTFDQFAGDLRTFPVEIRDGAVWVDPTPRRDARARQRERLQEGLERNIPLVIAKAVLTLAGPEGDPIEPFRIGLDFGTRYRVGGWGQGLTMHTCFMKLLPRLRPDERPSALYHGLSAVAVDTAGTAPRFPLRPLPEAAADASSFKRWFRQFVEVRDAEGAERCLVSAVRAGIAPRLVADMLLASATDHRYLTGGHLLDFTNKALEALDAAGWEYAELTLSSLARAYAEAERMEESNAWRHPVDLIAILEQAFSELSHALETGRSKRGTWNGRDRLVDVLLGEDAQASADALLEALREGASEEELAGATALSAATRIARFPTSNEFGDWDTALHTFTFANAVHQGLRRIPSEELLRGVFDAAMSVHLDRFLNVPAARLPPGGGDGELSALPPLLDQQQRVDEAGALVADHLGSGGDRDELLSELGSLLLREDRNFHTIQMLEASAAQLDLLVDDAAAKVVCVAAARYLAAHAPTSRSQGQTFEIARRLNRGERLYEEEST